MTREEWNSNPELRKGLIVLMADPVMVGALSVIEEESYGKVHCEMNALTLTTTGNALGAQEVGYQKALKNLKTLMDVPPPIPDPDKPHPMEGNYGVNLEHPTE